MFSSDDIAPARRAQSLLMLGEQARSARPVPSKLTQALAEARARRDSAIQRSEHAPTRDRAGSSLANPAHRADDRAMTAAPLRPRVESPGTQTFSAADRRTLQQINASIEEIRESLRECRAAIRELAEARARRRYF